jgi:hypothetical protein
MAGIGANALVLGIEIDAGEASSQIDALEKKLGVAIDRTKGLEHALVDGTKQLRAQEASAKKLAEALDESATGARAAAQASKDKAKADKDLQKAQDDLAAKLTKTTEIYRKGIGGGELAEKAKDIAKGFELWNDKSLTAQQRQQALAGAVGIGARVLTGYVGQVIEFARAVDAANLATRTQREQLVQLGPAYAAMNAAAQGTLTTQSALALRNELQANGLRLTSDQLAVATRAARDYSQVQGVEMSAATSLVTQALNGDSAAMTRLGISAGNSTEALRRLQEQQSHGVALGRSAQEQHDIEAQQLERARNGLLGFLGSISLVSGGLDLMHQAFTIWDADWTSLDSVNRALNASYPQVRDNAVAAAAAAARGARDAAEGAEKVRTGTSQTLEQFKANTTAVQAYVHQLEELRKASEAAGRASTDLSAALQPGEDAAARDARQLSVITQNAGRSRANRQHMIDLRRRAIASGQRVEDFNLGAGDNGGTPGFTAAQRDEMNRTITELEHQMDAVHVHFERLQGKTHETVQHYLERERTTMQRALDERQRLVALVNTAFEGSLGAERSRSQAANDQFDDGLTNIQDGKTGAWRLRQQAVQELATTEKTELSSVSLARKTAVDQEMQHHNLRLQMSQQWRETLQLDVTAAQSFAQFSTAAFQAVTGAVKQHLAAVIEGKESWGEALSGMLRDTLLNIATESAMQALLEGAKAIASAATYDYKGAGEHTLAAAAYAATAVATGVGASAMFSAQASGARSSGAPSPVSRAGMAANDNAGGGAGTVNYNFNGAIYDRDGMRAVVRTARQMDYDRGTQIASERRMAGGR